MAVEKGEMVFCAGPVAPHNGLSGVVVFVLEGKTKLRAVGRDFAVFDHEVQFGHFADAHLPQAVRSALNDRGSGLLPGVRAGADEFDNFVRAIMHDAVLQKTKYRMLCARGSMTEINTVQ